MLICHNWTLYGSYFKTEKSQDNLPLLGILKLSDHSETIKLSALEMAYPLETTII